MSLYTCFSHWRVCLTYKNWRGETSSRFVILRKILFDSSPWHPRRQWLMQAYDVEKRDWRLFALKDVKEWSE